MKASIIIDKAASYIGTKESPADSNNVIFNTDYYGYNVYGSAYPWCMAFVWDIFRMCGASDLFYDGQKTAYCPTLMYWAKSIGRFVTDNYKSGDVLFFSFSGDSEPAHTGFCYEDNGSTVITIEGNTSSDNAGSQSNGGMVAKRTRSKNSIIGAYRPPYEVEINYGWKQDDKGWWYVKPDGNYYKSCWASIDNKDYYFGKDGYMASNEYIKSADYETNKILYYVEKSGEWNGNTYTWKSNDKGWWLESETGWYPISEWCRVDNKWYYFDKKGYMVTGTIQIDGQKYKFGADGALIS